MSDISLVKKKTTDKKSKQGGKTQKRTSEDGKTGGEGVPDGLEDPNVVTSWDDFFEEYTVKDERNE